MKPGTSFISVYFSEMLKDAETLDQALVNLLIYHKIIEAHCECKHSIDLVQPVPGI